MNRMIAITIRPGATTAAARLISPLAVQDPAAGGDQHEEERPEQLGEQPPPLQARIVEVPAVAELEHQPVRHPRRKRRSLHHRVVRPFGWGRLNGVGHQLMIGFWAIRGIGTEDTISDPTPPTRRRPIAMSHGSVTAGRRLTQTLALKPLKLSAKSCV